MPKKTGDTATLETVGEAAAEAAGLIEKMLEGEQTAAETETETAEEAESEETEAEETDALSNTESEDEAEAQSEETESEEDAESKTDEGVVPEWAQKGFEKTRQKLVAQKKEAEEEVQTLKAEREQLKAEINALKALPPIEVDPDTDPAVLAIPEARKLLEEEQKLDKVLGNTKRLLRELARNPVTGLAELERLGYKFENESEAKYALEDAREEAREKANGLRSKREGLVSRHKSAFEKQWQEKFQEVQKVNSWMGDKDSEEYKIAELFVKGHPGVHTVLDGPEIIACYTLGKKMFDAKKKAAAVSGNGKEKLKPKAKAPSPQLSSVQPNQTGKTDDVKLLKAKAFQRGSIEESDPVFNSIAKKLV